MYRYLGRVYVDLGANLKYNTRAFDSRTCTVRTLALSVVYKLEAFESIISETYTQLKNHKLLAISRCLGF